MINIDFGKYIKRLVLAKEFFISLAFYFSFFGAPFVDSDFQVTYEDVPYIIPDKISMELKKNDQRSDLYNMVEELSKGRTLRLITLSNSTSEKISDIELKITDANHIYGIYGDSHSYRVRENISNYTRFEKDDKNGGYVNNINNLPPKTNLIIGIYGDFGSLSFLDPISIISSAKNASVVKLNSVRGVALFIHNNLSEIVVILLCVTLLVGIRRVHGIKGEP